MYNSGSMVTFNEYISAYREFIDAEISAAISLLPTAGQQIARHITREKGKALRPGLLLLAAGCFGRHDRGIYPFAAAVELLHIGSLLHDDIEDNASLRRGQKTAHTIYGVHGSLLTGDVLLSLAINMIAQNGNQDICKCAAKALVDTVNGQMAELAGLGYEFDQLETTAKKTSSLIAAACEIGALAAGANSTLCLHAKEFGYNLGIAYQVRDDWLDFFPSSETGKPQSADLNNGNFTLPLSIYAETLSSCEQKYFLTNLKTGTFSNEEKDTITKAIISPKLQHATKGVVESYLNKAKQSLKQFPESPEKEILEQIIAQITHSLERGPQCTRS